jgi:hypothetical protein
VRTSAQEVSNFRRNHWNSFRFNYSFEQSTTGHLNQYIFTWKWFSSFYFMTSERFAYEIL